MREADRNFIKTNGLEAYFEAVSLCQTSFHALSEEEIIISDERVYPDLTLVDGFEDTGVVTNKEIRELLLSSLRFLESSQGVSEIEFVEYINCHDAKAWAFLQEVSHIPVRKNRGWTINVYNNLKRKEEKRRELFLWAVAHEIGHIFWFDHVSEDWQKLWIWTYENLMPTAKMNFKDESASYNAREFFADTMAGLILQPRQIKNNNKNWRKTVMNRILFATIGQTVEDQISFAFKGVTGNSDGAGKNS